MDDYALYLSEEAKSDIVALHQFRILYDPSPTSYHFFFEGEEDSLFFMPEARRWVGDKLVNIYDCGGKKNVVEVRESINSDGYDASSCFFFVDRDFDDYLGTQVAIDEFTYITDNYSIENEISTVISTRILLEDVVRLSRADPEFSRIESIISNGLAKLYVEVRPLMAWIIAAKQAGCKPNLQNTNGLKGVITLSSGLPEYCIRGFAEFKKKVVVNGRTPDISDVLRWRRQLDLSTAKLWVRGKYEIWFFQHALVAAIEETNRRRKVAGGKIIRIPSALRDGRIFEILGGRTPSPASLTYFFQARLG